MGFLSKALASEVSNQPTSTCKFSIGGQTVDVGSTSLTPSDFDYVNSEVSKAASRLKMGYVSFQNDPTNFTGQVALLIRKARVVTDGEITDQKVFGLDDKAMLMRLGVEKVATMFRDLFSDQINEDEDGEAVAEKN